jgi:hypothetical protein
MATHLLQPYLLLFEVVVCDIFLEVLKPRGYLRLDLQPCIL